MYWIYMRILIWLIPVLSQICATTGCGQRTDEYYLSKVQLPDGALILVEQMRTPEQMTRGMMFRDELQTGRGMLFSHGQTGKFPYWMYQVKIPLDIIWLNQSRRIVEVSAQTPPCEKGPASTCPKYGGNEEALFVLELAGGVAAKHGLKAGDLLIF